MYLRTLTTLLILCLTNISLSLAQETQNSFKTGAFELKGTSRQLLGNETAAAYSDFLDPDEEITWNIFVPEDYDPAKPHGIFSYASDLQPNRIQSSWKTVAREKNFIWASVVGTRKFTLRKKMVLNVIALPLLQSMYQIDTSRIYVSGDRSGCSLASVIARVYPNIYSGAIYNICEPESWKKDLPPQIDLMKNHNYVFTTSSRNENRIDVRRVMKKYNNAGVKNTILKSYGVLEEDLKFNVGQLSGLVDFLDNPEPN